MRLRIHHFFDIIRDIGKGIEFEPHPYGHSNHIVARKIRDGEVSEIELVMGCDDICERCVHKVNGHCDDAIHHKGFSGKEEYNNFLDSRIMEVCGLHEHDILMPCELLARGMLYAGKMEWIYSVNDPEHTAGRKMDFLKGLKILPEK
ncbi:MAG TPA: DUF1284 domain-containing protein [Cyclobacteriaceae bacterium]|nr:DUF1284 domain-containing protein [Cyclobacteriaceae bacterium]